MRYKPSKFDLFLILMLVFCPVLPGMAQKGDLAKYAKIDSVVMKTMAEHHIVGLSIGIVKDNRLFYTRGYGLQNSNEPVPVDAYTNFLTCSISKLFTATAILQLSEKGKIDIKKKLIDYVPDFVMKDPRYKDITIDQMLTHTSGLPNIFNKNYIHPVHDSLALMEFAKKLSHEKLSYAPGVQLSEKTYSNTAYNLLGLVIEKVTRQTYSDYIKQHILDPVGMDSSSFFYQHISPQRRSTPHKKNWLTRKPVTAPYYPDIPQDKPCGNLNSCSYDLCQWMLHNLAIYNSPNLSERVLEKNTLLDMWTTKRAIPPYHTSMGWGWWVVQSDRYGKYVFHVGNDPGFSASLNISPGNNFGIVVLCNALYPKAVVWNKLPFTIIDLFASEWKKE